jgi:acetate kinase
MKTIITLLFVSFSALSTASASNVDVEVSPIDGEITSVNRLCPIDAICVTDGIVLDVTFAFKNGCADLASFSYEVNKDTNTVNITATQEEQTNAVCAAVYTERTEKISLVMMFPPMTVNFVGTPTSVVILPEDVNNN